MRRVYATIGRLELLRATCSSGTNANVAANDDSSSVTHAADSIDPGITARICVRVPRGEILTLTGCGTDLSTAVAQALCVLTRSAFRIVEATNRTLPRSSHPMTYGCHVELVADQAATSPSLMATGIGWGNDEVTALAGATLRALAGSELLRPTFRVPGAREVQESADRMQERIGLLFDTPLDSFTKAAMHEVLSDELHRFAVAQTILVSNDPNPHRRLRRFDASAVITDSQGNVLECNTQTRHWWEWYPGLANDACSLRSVYESLPASPPMAIPWIVRLFENPRSWLRFRGSIELASHDWLHILLGRGLLDQDEAFVIGFTMGSVKNLTRWERRAFKWIVSHLYPEPFRIPPELTAAYDLGVEAGTELGVRDIHRVPLEEHLDRPLGETRRLLHIDTHRLHSFYAREKAQLPDTLASIRLPIDAM